ncbi:hypothetical protein Z517_08995 [Fonsecaea pedrosoi CBS 271.37]|uniref:SP-RING-type domain-containing protein n=1 Tax=Fonsecaea pedrosoi CBS 271.37 TaxID=1442368 RepID=A0A0D2DFT1_9EURO|nr:uncharacterized protein Z517_08995 [Fonsecaea pedrosoi CBS 271.37]KIW76551.1 hypothetical protein Z517_08995 [Fonsecaea pedrosoi CBS 271.37]
MAPTQFEPQPLTAPLNDQALRSLSELQQHRDREKKAREPLKKAAEYLTDITGELNDRAYLRRVRHSKEKARRRAAKGVEDGAEGNDDPAEAEADARHDEFQRKVEALTKRMDLSIRGVIDDMAWLTEYPATLKAVVEKAQEITEQQRSDFHVQSPPRRTRQSRRVVDADETGNVDQDDEGEAHEAEGDTEAASSSHQTRMLPTIHPADSPHVHLSTALTQQVRTWTSKTLTERYAHNNDYKGWYRVLYDAKNPGESAPPMPDESLWFAAEEGRMSFSSSQRRRHRPLREGSQAEATSVTENGSRSGSDDEVEIAAEKTRLKCPITLLPYEDPVTSKNCNHSYERNAILSMLSASSSHALWTPTQLQELSQLSDRQRNRREREMRVKQVKCPECNVLLVEEDLVENPALKRRVARLLAQERRDNIATSDVDGDSSGDDDDNENRHRHHNDMDLIGTQRRPVGLGSSSPVPSRSTTARRTAEPIKGERLSSMSVVPQTQLGEDDGSGGGTHKNSQSPEPALVPTRPARRGRGRGRNRRIMDVDDDNE